MNGILQNFKKNLHLNSYYTLYGKHQDLIQKYQQLESCHKCLNEDPVEVIKPPAKKRKMAKSARVEKDPDVEMEDLSRKDPLVHLPENCATQILGYLNRYELFTACTVSKVWRNFIQVRNLFNDKNVFKPTFNYCSLPLMNEIFGENINHRPYKHVITPFNLRRLFYGVINPVQHFAMNVETLEIKDIEETAKMPKKSARKYNEPEKVDILLPPTNFPRLRKLTFSLDAPFNFFDGSKFPALTHLCITATQQTSIFYWRGGSRSKKELTANSYDVRNFIRLFPQLETLILKFESVKDTKPRGKNYERIDGIAPKIKTLYTHHLFETISREFYNSLERLEISELSGINNVLRDFKVLKHLYVHALHTIYDDGIRKEFHRNESIESLMLWNIFITNPTFKRLEFMKSLLSALPNLKFLELFCSYSLETTTLEILKFAGKFFFNIFFLKINFFLYH